MARQSAIQAQPAKVATGMKSELDCLHCLMRQAVNTVRLATSDPELQREVIDRTAAWIQEADLARSPAAVSTVVYRIVSDVTGVADPYAEIKESTNREALRLAPALTRMIAAAADPLDVALHVAVAGNVIDVGIGHDFDIERDVEDIVRTPFAKDDVDDFRAELVEGRRMLYLGDNSGEIVFDRLLIEYLLKQGLDVTFVVKSGPIINDATMLDADAVGISDLVPVIETGSDDIGVDFHHISGDMRDALEGADLILAKGHGNFESCVGAPYNLYFLLKAKCDVVAGALGVRMGDIVFKHEKNT